VGTAKLPRPANKAELLDALRQALAAAPKPLPEMAGVPLAGGLVGYSSYDVVRYFERLPARARADRPVPDLHYVAPESLLVFDHLTRGIALLHAGSEAERQALRRDVIRALRGGLPNYSTPTADPGSRYSPAEASLSPEQYMAGVKRTQEYSRRRRLPARARRAVLGPPLAGSFRGLSRVAPHQSLALHVLLPAR
jgi:anthranilate synthase component 1